MELREILPSLDSLGLRYGTDKSSFHHDYLEFYDRFFSELRHRPVTLLEIGVLRGQSIQMWNDYFQAGRIIGVDVDPRLQALTQGRVLIEVADQSRVDHLVEIGRRHAPFDIVIDDGSHMWNHQITTLTYLMPFVRPGGYYVLEDIDTSFGAYVEKYRGTSDISAYDYLNRLNEYLVADVQLDIAAENDSFIRTFAPQIDFVALHRRTALIRRRASEQPPRRAMRQPLVDDGQAPGEPPVGTLTGHLAYVGDVRNAEGLAVGVRGSVYHLQGFSAALHGHPPDAMLYQARLQDGHWTDWAPAGTFVGTRGASQSLTGFAVRLAGPLAETHEVLAIGSFVGEERLSVAVAGQPCCATQGEAALEAMQIRLVKRTRPPDARPAPGRTDNADSPAAAVEAAASAGAEPGASAPATPVAEPLPAATGTEPQREAAPKPAAESAPADLPQA